MIGLVKIAAAARNAVALCCLFTAGCAAVTRLPTAEPVAPAAGPVAPTAVEAPPVVAPPPEPVTAQAATVPSLDAAPEPPPAVIETPNAPVAEAAADTAVAAPVAAPAAPAAPVTAAPLDFTSLGTRLRETKTIGVLTKLAVKNQADGLLDQFRAYHTRQGAATLSELRRSYDMLVLKLISLLQDGDPPLARDIVQSQTAIWEILADPRKFTESNLMAGATT